MVLKDYACTMALISEIRTDDLTDSRVHDFLYAHLQDMHASSPPESVHALDLQALQSPDITFWTAWLEGQLVSMGALKQLSAAHGEIKSMRTAPQWRGRGIAKQLLTHILQQARSRGLTQVSLETGSMASFAAARALYLKHGFKDCPPFADYQPDPHSVFMTLDLGA
jgi:putative acetyltransferase